MYDEICEFLPLLGYLKIHILSTSSSSSLSNFSSFAVVVI